MTGFPMQLLTTDAVAEILGVSTRTVEDWRLDEIGPPVTRLGRRTIRYRSDQLVAWIAQRSETPGDSCRSEVSGG